jgi:hypothetical protein
MEIERANCIMCTAPNKYEGFNELMSFYKVRQVHKNKIECQEIGMSLREEEGLNNYNRLIEKVRKQGKFRVI